MEASLTCPRCHYEITWALQPPRMVNLAGFPWAYYLCPHCDYPIDEKGQ